jgi:hypothetical protein
MLQFQVVPFIALSPTMTYYMEINRENLKKVGMGEF